MLKILMILSLLVIFGGAVTLVLVLTGVLDKWASGQRERAEALRLEKAYERGDRVEIWRLTMRGRM